MDIQSNIRYSALMATALGATVFQMGCVPPPDPLTVEQLNPEVVVKAGQPVTLQYTVNSTLARNKSIFYLADEFILRNTSWESDDVIKAPLYNASAGGLLDYQLYCDFFDITCWAQEHIGTAEVVPVRDTTYTFTVTDQTGEFLLSPGGNLLVQLIDWVISTPPVTETYQASVDVVVDPDIEIGTIPWINLNPLNVLPLGSLRDCIGATGALMTSDLTDLTCIDESAVNTVQGLQFFYNLDTLTLGSAAGASGIDLRYLQYLTGATTIDISGIAISATANGCADQTALQAALPGVNVQINGGC